MTLILENARFNFKLKKFNSNCFILIDPLKKTKEIDKFLLRYEKILPNKIKYLITVNMYPKKIPNRYNLIYFINASKNRCLKIYQINCR